MTELMPELELLPEQVRAVEYLRRKGSEAPMDSLRTQWHEAGERFEALLATVAVDERGARPAVGKWSPWEILDHLVLSHAPAVEQLASLLAGVSPPGVAIPAGLHSPDNERRSWEELYAELGAVHRAVERLAAETPEPSATSARAVVEMVVKAAAPAEEGRRLHWFEELDAKAYLQALRVHTLEHHQQLERTLAALRAG